MSYAMLATLRRLRDLTDDNPTTQNYFPPLTTSVIPLV
jgi:hypothetical protein